MVAGGEGVGVAAQVAAVSCKRHNGHDLRRGCDDESGAPTGAVSFSVDVDLDAPQGTVIHVHGAWPGDSVRVEVKRVAVEQVGVNQRSQQIVGGSHGVNVAVEVQIDLLARFHLRQAASSRAALHAKDRSQRRFAGGDQGLLPDTLQPLDQPDRGDGFTLPRNCWGGGGDQDELAAARKCRIGQQVQLQFRAVGP